MLLSDAIERVGKMLDACPHGRPKNEKSYIGALANVLCQYPKIVAVKCTDPLKGVIAEREFLPTVASLVVFCERESEFLRHAVDRENLEMSRVRQQHQRAQDAVQLAEARKARPTLDELKAKHGPNWGIIQHPHDQADKLAREASAAKLAEANARLLRREYAAAGEEPLEAGHGIAVSRELSQQLRDQAERLAGARARNRMESARMIGAEADALAEKAAAE